MKRYVAMRPRGGEWWEQDEKGYLWASAVHEKETMCVKTGIIDKHGNDIYMVDETGPIGYVIHGDSE